jgi:hypothetical protein
MLADSVMMPRKITRIVRGGMKPVIIKQRSRGAHQVERSDLPLDPDYADQEQDA